MPATRASKKRQTRLNFSPLPSSSPARSSQPAAIRDRIAAVVIDDGSRPLKRRRLGTAVEDEGLPSPQKSSAARPTKSTASAKTPSQASSPPSSFMKHPVRSSAKRKKLVPVTEASSSSSEGVEDSDQRAANDDSDEPIATPTPKRGRLPKASLEIPDDSESDATPVPSRSKPRPLAKSIGRRRRSPSFVVDEEPDAEEFAPQRVKKSRRRRDLSSAEDEEDPEPLPRPRSSGSRLKRKRQTSPTAASSSDDFPSSAARSRLRRGRDLERNSEEDRDLQEDLDFLRSTSPAPQVQRSPAKSAKQKALEVLKKRRAQQAGDKHIDLVSDEEDTAERDNNLLDDDGIQDEEEQAISDAGDDQIDDFVIEDNSDPGETHMSQLPFEFRLRTMKPKELFKFVVEYFVQKKINPGFDKDNEVYRVALERTNDFVEGMAGSKFSSSAWTGRFIRALKARPQIEENGFNADALFRDRCDACNRSGHPATWEVRFHGKAYDRRTFEEFSDDEDEDDGTSDTRLPPENTRFYIGRFCMRKARVGHALQHWRFHLNEWIVDYLQAKGHLSAEKIVERDSWSTRKRNKKVNKIVNRMEKDGEIKALYHDFKNETNTAHNTGESHFHYSSD